MLARIRTGILLLVVLLLQSCGGGGDGDDDGGDPPPPPAARLALSTGSITAGATPGELAPTDDVVLTVTHPPAGGLWVQYGHSTNGIERLEFSATSPTSATLHVVFRLPSTLQNGDYADLIEVHVCPDDQCATDIEGSPKTVQVSYGVSGDGLTSATISRTAIEVTADRRDNRNPEESTTVTLSNLPPTGVIARVTESSPAIQHVGGIEIEEIRNYLITFTAPSQLDTGIYDDLIALELCYDESCVRQVRGSPFAIATTYNVTLGLEPGLSSLQVERLEGLTHDVIDAEFSTVLNAIVMVGSQPISAIYLYDIASATERQQVLGKPPTSVSVAPDGLTAAVGHDANISVVDLASIGAPAAPAPILLDVSVNAGDVILDSQGRVHALQPYEEGDGIRSVDVATNAEQVSASLHFGAKFRRQPAGDVIYAAEDFVPSGLIRWDVSSGTLLALYGDPYFGGHDACGDVWFSADGGALYTTCGRSFQVGAGPADDMIYAGTLELTAPATRGDNGIRSLSHSPADNEIALIESGGDCNPFIDHGPCYTRLAYHDPAFLNRNAIYGIGPISIAGVAYAHLGRHVFHGGDGRKYLIGELESPPSEDERFWLSVIE